MKSSWAAAAGIVTVILVTMGAAYRNNQGMVAPQDAPFDGGVGAPAITGPLTLSGTLVDAGCQNRSAENLASPPMPLNTVSPAEPPQEQASSNSARAQLGFANREVEPPSAPVTASGITVDKQTLDSEREDIVSHQSKDLFTRQPDDSCAISGDTKAFALLTDKGRLLNLDGGGNTWAWQAVQSTDAGRANLNGTGPAFKPHVTVKGQIWADQLIVQSLNF